MQTKGDRPPATFVRRVGDMVKLQEGFAANVEMLDAGLDDAGEMHASAVRLAIVAIPDDAGPDTVVRDAEASVELPACGAQAAMELSLLLLLAAAVLDRDLVARELARQRDQNALLGRLFSMPVSGTH